mgnify:CR=1 FL=1
MSISQVKQMKKKVSSVTSSSSTSSSNNNNLIQKKSKNHSDMFSNSPIQKKANNTGLPNDLKSGMESMSGQDLSDVKVHSNSAKPAQLKAHAYAQGNDIHTAPGQEKHLPHELAHVVQQKQGKVKPTDKNGAPVNDDPKLENEADVMGSKALKKNK